MDFILEENAYDYEIIGELKEYLPSMKFDSYYDDNLLQPEVGERAARHSYFTIQRSLPDSDCSKGTV